MPERLVAIPLEGVMHLYAVNGEGPVEVGRLDVGDGLDVHSLAMIGAALSDLRSVITNGPRDRAPMPVARPRSSVLDGRPPRPRTTYSLPQGSHSHGLRQSGVRGAAPDPESLNGRIRAYLSEHGPSTIAEMLPHVGANATPTKTARQRVSTSLATLKRAGTVERVGRGRNGRWSMS